MVRLITNSILALIFLITTTGFTVSEHYCSNILISISINSEPEPCCNKDECCHNESIHYQVKEDFSTPGSMNIVQIPVIDLFFSTVFMVQEYKPLKFDSEDYFIVESPPPLKTHTVLSLLQSYLC